MALSKESRLVLLCGRYEGVDERLVRRSVDEELSIGDYVLSGGELAAMVVIDAVVRQLPGALGDGLSAEQDSFVNGLLDRKSTRLNSSHGYISYAVFCLKKKKNEIDRDRTDGRCGHTSRHQ